MEAQNILNSLKSILNRDIKRLSKKVLDTEEDTYINGALCARESILQCIENLEEMQI